MHTLKQSQFLPVSRKVLWSFVSVPQNLNQITPPKMAFKIVGEQPDSAYAGLLLEYKVRIPVLGWTSWLTEIKYVTQGYSFMDEQRVGPYKLWLHTHTLEDVEGGTKMTDVIMLIKISADKPKRTRTKSANIISALKPCNTNPEKFIFE